MTELPQRLELSRQGRTVTLRGEIDAHTAVSLADPLAELGDGDDVHLNMAEVGFIDSSGLRLVIETHERLRAVGRSLVIASPSSQVRRLIEVSGLAQVLNVTD